jgi:hypothetical protein
MKRREVLARVVRLNDALTVGDVGLAAALGHDLAHDLATPVRRRSACEECDLAFDFPGQLDEHVRVTHPDVWDALAAGVA